MTQDSERIYREAAELCLMAAKALALTGAGISVDCGIPDFRSRGGLWSRFDPSEYATLTTFLENPEKAWKMYRELGLTVKGKKPGEAHTALAELERRSQLDAVITQNIDGLHSAAGSINVIEMHGECRSLECLRCGELEPAKDVYLKEGTVPLCDRCGYALKPNVVLFQESVRGMDEVETLLSSCDLLLLIGTSATVFPAAEFPYRVLSQGGQLIEFNLEATELTSSCQVCLRGRIEETVPKFVLSVLSS